MSESNSVQVSIVQRTSFDTAAALNMLILLGTGQTMRNQVSVVQSQTLRTDANVQDYVRVGGTKAGSLPFEFTFPIVSEALWYLLRGVLRSTETAAATQVTSVTATSGVLSVGSSNVETGVEVGDVLQILNASNVLVGDGYYRVTAFDAGAHTVTVAGTLPDATTSYKVLRGARMKNGTQRYYFDAEVGRLDVNLFELYSKCVVNGLSFTITDQGIINASFDMLGVSSSRNTSTLCLGHTAPTTGLVMDSLGVPVNHIAAADYSAKSIGLSINNNIRARTEVGTDGTSGFSWGAHQVNMTMSSYLANWTEMGKYVAGTETSSWFAVKDSTGKAVSFSIPAMKWAELTTDTQGLNQDDLLTGTGAGKISSTEACTIRVQRWV